MNELGRPRLPFVFLLWLLTVIGGGSAAAHRSEVPRDIRLLSLRMPGGPALPVGIVSLLRPNGKPIGLTHSSIVGPVSLVKTRFPGGSTALWTATSWLPRHGLALLGTDSAAGADDPRPGLDVSRAEALPTRTLTAIGATDAGKLTKAVGHLGRSHAYELSVAISGPNDDVLPSSPLLVEMSGVQTLVGVTRKVVQLAMHSDRQSLFPALSTPVESHPFQTNLRVARVFPELLEYMMDHAGALSVPEPCFEAALRESTRQGYPSLVASRVYTHGPEALAGLQPEDRILAVNEETVRSEEQLARAYLKARGDGLVLDVWRPSSASNARLVYEPSSRDALESEHLQHVLGLQLAETDDGLQVSEVGPHLADWGGLSQGDCLVATCKTTPILAISSVIGGDQRLCHVQPAVVGLVETVESPRDLWAALMDPEDPVHALRIRGADGGRRWLSDRDLWPLRLGIARHMRFTAWDALYARLKDAGH